MATFKRGSMKSFCFKGFASFDGIYDTIGM